MEGMPGATKGPTPIVRMFGITMEGNSVLAHIHGYTPYFYVPAQDFKKEDCVVFKVFYMQLYGVLLYNITGFNVCAMLNFLNFCP